MRPKSNTVFWNRQGTKHLALLSILPRKVGQSKLIRVCIGQPDQLPLRLIAVRVPEEVVEQRRKQLEEKACGCRAVWQIDCYGCATLVASVGLLA